MHLIILILLLWETALQADPLIDINYKYYSVNTTSEVDLLSDLNNASPIKENGKIFHAHTDTHISWNFWWKKDYGECTIDRVSTKVKITYTLPKLSNKYKSRNLLLIWNKWYPALIKHEKKHASHAIEIANIIERSIKSLPFKSSCKELENIANSTGNKLIKKLNKLDIEYDKKTGHGKTEGANLSTYL